jgi:hypothetical protein
MKDLKHRRISEVLGERSFRNGLGYVVFFLLVMLPTVDAWQSGSEIVQGSDRGSIRTGLGINRINAWPDGRPTVREKMNASWWPDTSRLMWFFGKTSLAMFGATLSMLILMPFRGCKRFAILFGPPTGLLVVSVVGFWLTGRDEIYRFEPVIVGLIAALPPAGLWFICCKWAFERQTQRDEVVIAQLVSVKEGLSNKS